MSAAEFPALLQTFFTDRLVQQRRASPHTIKAYRNTFRLLLRFAAARLGRAASSLVLAELDAPFVGEFLDHLERERANGARSRNARLAALQAFFRYVALTEPAHALHCQRVLAIPSKRFERGIVEFLSDEEVEALLAVPDTSAWMGRRDRAILIVAIQTGLRVSELTALRRQDLASTSVHQAVHGYRDGHRLLSSSIPLGSDAARAMLVLSDMSGPSMQPGFDEYLTGYPLAGTDYFVFAKTWYASEMQRPGCVWTHSLLVPRGRVASISAAQLIEGFRRPQVDGVDAAATSPVVIDQKASIGGTGDGFADKGLAATMIGAVLGQPRPVIVVADTAAQFEVLFLRLWEELWPAERTRFSFCTGALMPRASAGVLLDLQAVPRAIPPSQFRKSASAALVLDLLRTPGKPEGWVDLVLDGAVRADPTFRSWLEAAAGADANRAVVPSLAPLFGAWHAPGSSARSVLASVVDAKDLDPGTRSRLIGMAFDRAATQLGAAGRRELIQELCGYRANDFAPIATVLEDHTRRLFEESRTEGVALVLSLLGSELTEVGERVLRAAVLLLVPNDVETIGDAQAPLERLPAVDNSKDRLE